MRKEDIGYIFGLVSDLGNGRQLSVSGNFPEGASVKSMNIEVDKLRRVVDRQQAKSASRGASDEIEVLALRKKGAIDDLTKIDAKAESRGLSSAQRQQREAAIAHIERMGEDIEFKQKVLNRLEEEAK